MSSSQNIKGRDSSSDPAPTPQNTPLDTTVLSSRPANLGKPTVEAIGEGDDEDDGAEDVSAVNPASLLANNPALLALAQKKFGSLVGQSSGYIESLPPAVRRRIDGLKGVQAQHSKIESEFQMAILELEKKASPPVRLVDARLPADNQFLSKFSPLYERRAEIIAGKAEPTDTEVEEGKAADSDDEDEEDEESGAKITEIADDAEGKDAADLKGVPAFWLTALANHGQVGSTIEEHDEEAMTDVRLSYLDDKPGFKLHFTFGPNAFFEDTELTKTYFYQEQVGYGGDFVYDKAIGHDIKWKADKDLTKKVEIKKQRNKSTGRTRTIKKDVPQDSFFNFFKPPQPPTEDLLEREDLDEDILEELDGKLELDYSLGEEFKEKIIPRAVDYFTGRALRYDGDFDDEDEDDFEDEDSYDDDDDEDNEAAPAPSGEECKQQ